MTIEHAVPFMPSRFHLPACIIGQMAFPLFLFAVVQGYSFTRDRCRYFLNILLLAIISEPVFRAYFHHPVNDIFLFSYVLILLELSRENRRLALILNFSMFFIPGYWFYAGAMALAMYHLSMMPQIMCVFSVLLLASQKYFVFQFMGIMAYFFVHLSCRFNFPKLLKYAYYPGHLLILSILRAV